MPRHSFRIRGRFARKPPEMYIEEYNALHPEEKAFTLAHTIIPEEDIHGDFIWVDGQNGEFYSVYTGGGAVGNIYVYSSLYARESKSHYKSLCGAPLNVDPELIEAQHYNGFGPHLHYAIDQDKSRQWNLERKPTGLARWDLFLGQYLGLRYNTQKFVSHCF